MWGFRRGTIAATLLLSLWATGGRAENISVSAGLSDGTVLGYHGIGVGGAVNVPLGRNGWSLNFDGRYEFGNKRVESDSAGIAVSTIDEKLGGYRIRGGVDHVVAAGPMHIYLGTGLSWASHKFRVEVAGLGEDESAPYNVFGINSRLGGSVPLSSDAGLDLFVQFENTLGWGSTEATFSDETVKRSQTDVMNGLQLGLRYRIRPGE